MVLKIKYRKTKRGGDIVSSVISKIPIRITFKRFKRTKYRFCG